MANILMKLSLGLLFIAAVFPNAFSRDDTLEDRSIGQEVTEAVLRKIKGSGLFQSDNSFLIRLAYVESRFGQNNNTFREDYFGGIWQVEESVFRITQTNHTALSPLHIAIRTKFGIDWRQVTWKQLVRPLYSGLAAALYFTRVAVVESIPQKISQQADYWRKYYRPLGEIANFTRDSEDLRNQTRCRGKMDLCVVLDASGSINMANPLNYGRAKNFVATMIESFSLDYTRIGMLIYSDERDTRVIFEIHNNDTIDGLVFKAKNAPYPGHGTRTDVAIKTAIQMFNRSSAIVDTGVPKIMTVFTDGKSDKGSDMTGAIRALRNTTIKPISVGIGNSINMAELKQIALDDDKSVFTLQDFEGLQDFLQQITSVTCEIPQKPSLDNAYNDSLIQNEKRIYRVAPPPEGITINVTVSVGKTNGYWSHTVEVPSAVIHDGVIDGLTFIPAPSKTMQAGDEEEDEPSIYFTIQGVEPKNNYTLTVAQGNKGGADNGAPVIVLTNCIFFIGLILHVFLN